MVFKFFVVSFCVVQENLWNTLRSSWMKVRDLEYVENQLIPRLEKYVTDVLRFSMELEKNAVENAAAEAAKEEMRAKGQILLRFNNVSIYIDM
jgi:hypothetical protein